MSEVLPGSPEPIEYSNFLDLVIDAIEAEGPWQAIWPISDDPETWVKVQIDQRPGQKRLITVTNHWLARAEMVRKSFYSPSYIEGGGDKEAPFELRLGAQNTTEAERTNSEELPDQETRRKGLTAVMTVLGKEHEDTDPTRHEELLKIIETHAAGTPCDERAGNSIQHDFSNAWEGIGLVMNTDSLLSDTSFSNATNHCLYLNQLAQDEARIQAWHQAPDFSMGARIILADLYKKRQEINNQTLFKPEAEVENWVKKTMYARALELVEILIPALEKIVDLAENFSPLTTDDTSNQITSVIAPETSPEKLTVAQIKNPFFWVEYNKTHSDSIRIKSQLPKELVIGGLAISLRDSEGYGSFATEINGHKLEYSILKSAASKRPTIILSLEIDGEHAIYSLADANTQECYRTETHMEETETPFQLKLDVENTVETEKETVHFSPSQNPDRPKATHVAIQQGKTGKLIWAVYVTGQNIPESVSEDPDTELITVEVARSKYDFQPFLEK
jgi:hypothetical protein